MFVQVTLLTHGVGFLGDRYPSINYKGTVGRGWDRLTASTYGNEHQYEYTYPLAAPSFFSLDGQPLEIRRTRHGGLGPAPTESKTEQGGHRLRGGPWDFWLVPSVFIMAGPTSLSFVLSCLCPLSSSSFVYFLSIGSPSGSLWNVKLHRKRCYLI